ncbi:MAG: hypothetical protein K2X71_18980 [Methylobacterium sp.]|uniref:hypothetical protein n=1 Tax=Methylobacterium sp. TaxID=409 RepID=UPI00258C4FCF|nr:hypothetical protein [Methylobacterium sp.]MBY0298086.1 hypothetical protein [Methylobacterium sp.]
MAQFVVTVGLGETPVFVLEGGRLLVPDTSAERAAVAAALAQAAAQLLTLPAPEPLAEHFTAHALPVAQGLARIGTDAAVALVERLNADLNAVTATITAGNRLIAETATAQGERSLVAIVN